MKRIVALLMALIMAICSLTFSFAQSVGDVTGDGKIDSRDIAAIQKHLVNIKQLGEAKKPFADVNEDGAINSRDMARIQLHIVRIKPIIGSESTFSIQFIDVGQADAALVECDGRYMLIDGGNKGDSSLIYSVLRENQVSVLDILVATHAHEDHIGGLPGALNYASANLVLCPTTSYNSDAFDDFEKYANQKGGGIVVPRVGNEYTLGSANIKILGVNGGSDVNDTSIVLKITYGDTSFLFTGDAEREAEQTIINSGADLSATVLKVGHHGAETSTGYVFLREIMPEYAVISVGEGNSYGHPTEATLSRLQDAGVTLFRTDLQGDIYCVSDGYTVSFTTEKNDNANVFEPNNGGGNDNPNNGTSNNNGTSSEDCDYILNNNSKKFHYPSCSSAARISDSNKEYYNGSRSALISRGYSPCGICKP